jgi:hypothetical protein
MSSDRVFFVDLKDVPPESMGTLLFVDPDVLAAAVQSATGAAVDSAAVTTASVCATNPRVPKL